MPSLTRPFSTAAQDAISTLNITFWVTPTILDLISLGFASTRLILLCTFHVTDDVRIPTPTSLLTPVFISDSRNALPERYSELGSAWRTLLQFKHPKIYAPRASKHIKQVERQNRQSRNSSQRLQHPSQSDRWDKWAENQ